MERDAIHLVHERSPSPERGHAFTPAASDANAHRPRGRAVEQRHTGEQAGARGRVEELDVLPEPEEILPASTTAWDAQEPTLGPRWTDLYSPQRRVHTDAPGTELNDDASAQLQARHGTGEGTAHELSGRPYAAAPRSYLLSNSDGEEIGQAAQARRPVGQPTRRQAVVHRDPAGSSAPAQARPSAITAGGDSNRGAAAPHRVQLATIDLTDSPAPLQPAASPARPTAVSRGWREGVRGPPRTPPAANTVKPQQVAFSPSPVRSTGWAPQPAQAQAQAQGGIHVAQDIPAAAGLPRSRRRVVYTTRSRSRSPDIVATNRSNSALSLVPASSREQELREWSDGDEAAAQDLASSHYHSGSETSGRSSSVSRRVVRRSSEPPVTAGGGAGNSTRYA